MRKHLALCVLLAVPAAFAQGPTTNPAASNNGALEQKIRDLGDGIIALEGQVRLLKSQPGSSAPAPRAASTHSNTAAPTPSPNSTEATPQNAAGQGAPQEPGPLSGGVTWGTKAVE